MVGQAPLGGAWPWFPGRGGLPGAVACTLPPCAASGRAPWATAVGSGAEMVEGKTDLGEPKT